MVKDNELQTELNRLNDRYCKNTKHELTTHHESGRTIVSLDPKWRKNKRTGRFYAPRGTGGSVTIASGANKKEALFNLFKQDSYGEVKRIVKVRESRSKVRRKK